MPINIVIELYRITLAVGFHRMKICTEEQGTFRISMQVTCSIRFPRTTLLIALNFLLIMYLQFSNLEENILWMISLRACVVLKFTSFFQD